MAYMSFVSSLLVVFRRCVVGRRPRKPERPPGEPGGLRCVLDIVYVEDLPRCRAERLAVKPWVLGLPPRVGNATGPTVAELRVAHGRTHERGGRHRCRSLHRVGWSGSSGCSLQSLGVVEGSVRVPRHGSSNYADAVGRQGDCDGWPSHFVPRSGDVGDLVDDDRRARVHRRAAAAPLLGDDLDRRRGSRRPTLPTSPCARARRRGTAARSTQREQIALARARSTGSSEKNRWLNEPRPSEQRAQREVSIVHRSRQRRS